MRERHTKAHSVETDRTRCVFTPVGGRRPRSSDIPCTPQPVRWPYTPLDETTKFVIKISTCNKTFLIVWSTRSREFFNVSSNTWTNVKALFGIGILPISIYVYRPRKAIVQVAKRKECWLHRKASKPKVGYLWPVGSADFRSFYSQTDLESRRIYVRSKINNSCTTPEEYWATGRSFTVILNYPIVIKEFQNIFFPGLYKIK